MGPLLDDRQCDGKLVEYREGDAGTIKLTDKNTGRGNAKLKEDLTFFEVLLPNATGNPCITIQRLAAELPTPMQLRYRMLIIQCGKSSGDFVGGMEAIVTAMVAEKKCCFDSLPGECYDGRQGGL